MRCLLRIKRFVINHLDLLWRFVANEAASMQKLEDLQSQDRQRYVQEMKGVYNADVQPQRSKTSATGAA